MLVNRGRPRTDLTDKDIDDASHVSTLLDQLTQDPASFVADGAYDRAATYNQPRPKSVRPVYRPALQGVCPRTTATISPTPRDLHVLAVDERGRMNGRRRPAKTHAQKSRRR